MCQCIIKIRDVKNDNDQTVINNKVYIMLYIIDQVQIFKLLYNLYMEQLNQERQEQQQRIITSTINSHKIQLITNNVNILQQIFIKSLIFAVSRIIVFIIINYHPQSFLALEQNKTSIDATAFIFFILTSFIDLLSVMNDVQVLKFIEKQKMYIRQIKNKLRINAQEIPVTRLGSHQNYLSIFDLIKIITNTSRQSGSIHDTIKVLHIFITFYGVGSFTINTQSQVPTELFKVIFLWAYILSIYYSNFQLYYSTLQISTGPYVQSTSISYYSEEQKIKKDNQWKQLIEVFITNVRKPYKIIYIIIIIAQICIFIIYSDINGIQLFSFMTIFSIICHITELIYSNSIQNKLINNKYAYLSYKYITSHRIIWQATKQNRTIHHFITSINRYVIVMLIMSYFRSRPQKPIITIMFVTINIMTFIGQYIKYRRCSFYKLYKLHRYQQINLTQPLQCAICLTSCVPAKDLVKLPCFSNHIFHIDCMKKWLKQRKQCPLCRYSLQYYQLVQ